MAGKNLHFTDPHRTAKTLLTSFLPHKCVSTKARPLALHLCYQRARAEQEDPSESTTDLKGVGEGSRGPDPSMKMFTHLSKAPFAQHSVLPESVFGYWLSEKYQESDIRLLKVDLRNR